MVEIMKDEIKPNLQQPYEDWADRVEGFLDINNFVVDIQTSQRLLGSLSTEQKGRLAWKLELVEKAARYMAVGMLKGTLKYSHDAYTTEQWMAHVIDEGADQLNYQLLLENAFQKSNGYK